MIDLQFPSKKSVQSYIFTAILILLFVAVLRLFAPFFSVLLWSTLLYILISPLHRRLTKKINFETRKGKLLRSFWAVIFTLGTMILILGPLSFAAVVFFREIIELARSAADLLYGSPEFLQDFFGNISRIIYDISGGQIKMTAETIERGIMDFFSARLENIVLFGTNVILNIGGFSINLLLMMFSLFFFFIDGPYLSRLVLNAIPIKKDYLSTLSAKFLDITRNLFAGYFLVALLQSVAAYIIYIIFDVRGSLVFAVLTFMLVFIPMFGASLIYLPITLMKLASGDIAGGIIFFLVCLVIISGIDNVLRPFLLKDRIQLHPLVIFFTILGGLIVFGFNGFILGPIFVIFFLTVLDIFLTEHKINVQGSGEQ